MSPVPKEEREKPVDDNPECNNVEETVQEYESETDSETETSTDGYELLPQEPEVVPHTEISQVTGPITPLPDFAQLVDDAEPQNTTTPPVFPFTVPDPPAEDAASLLWNQANPAPRTEMDKVSQDLQEKGQEERVRNAMKGFQLPSSSIPDWAKNVPDDKWKEHLLDKLLQLDTKDHPDVKEHKPDDDNSSQNGDSCLK